MLLRTIHQLHHGWDRARPSVMTIAPGDEVSFAVREASDGQLHPGSIAEDLRRLDFTRLLPLCGPVRVDGAEPGDLLRIQILHIAPAAWGWTANIPGFGLLADDFPDPALYIWKYDGAHGSRAMFSKHASVPIRPFPGTMGVAPAVPGVHSASPPGCFGGNLDIRDLVVGSELFLPVQVPGAIFSVGDTHAAQGDGEVCGTALESPMHLTLRFDLIRGVEARNPSFYVPRSSATTIAMGEDGWDATTGIGPDLMEAARDAVRAMIDLLVRRTGMPAVDAYMLCSVAGDLRISEIVNRPNWVVSFHLPRRIFR